MNTQDIELRILVKQMITIMASLCEHQMQLSKLITIISPPLSESDKKILQSFQETLATAVTLLRQQSKNLPPS